MQLLYICLLNFVFNPNRLRLIKKKITLISLLHSSDDYTLGNQVIGRIYPAKGHSDNPHFIILQLYKSLNIK